MFIPLSVEIVENLSFSDRNFLQFKEHEKNNFISNITIYYHILLCTDN
ncbi:hypothetical protein SDC9_200837 [bioreactor metagenome]|uniref:Uncharacterized protein n=1 Tax=bioreactor metagenome TaxID=1076179 RepID=A0A645J150_9ZZZZ